MRAKKLQQEEEEKALELQEIRGRQAEQEQILRDNG